MERFPSDNYSNQKSPYPSIKSCKKTNKTTNGYNEYNTIQKEKQELIDEPAPVAGPLLENNPKLQNTITEDEYSKPYYEEDMYPNEQVYPEEKESVVKPSNVSNKQGKKVMNLLDIMNKRLKQYENAMEYFQNNKLNNKKRCTR